MAAHAYTEDQLVEQPAIGLFAELGWTTVSAMEETFGVAGALQQETKGKVVLVSRLRAALEKLNPALPPDAMPSPPPPPESWLSVRGRPLPLADSNTLNATRAFTRRFDFKRLHSSTPHLPAGFGARPRELTCPPASVRTVSGIQV